MAITAALCCSFKLECLPTAAGIHLAGDVYKLALYRPEATLNEHTTAYTPDGEVEGEGYTPGGAVLDGLTTALDGTTAILDWAVDPTWEPATIRARGGLIYNSSKRNRAVCVLDFDKLVKSTDGLFRVKLPTPDATRAAVRI